MASLWTQLEPLLSRVQKPARYIGCEDGSKTTGPVGDDAIAADTRVSWVFAYPDTYEVGLPNQGLQILFEVVNERDDAYAERTYAPWTDLEAEMRAEGVPLFTVDTHRAVSSFDAMGFNLSAELTFTNVLNMVDLCGLPVRSADRVDGDLLVVVGGHCTFNPEPIADFVDLVVLGDGEEVIGEITEVIAAHKAAAGPDGVPARADLLGALAEVEGVYVPSLYESTYDGQELVETAPIGMAPDVVEKRTISDLGDWPYPKQQLVPLTEVVHDRLNIEVFRGCTRGCRFCQAGMITRPVRERPADQVRTMVSEGLRRTGYDEVALTSLSTADYSGIGEVVEGIVDDPTNCGQVSVSLPSLRVDAFTVGIAASIQKARRTGLTFAPEAGTWRMRQVINKLIDEDDLYGAVESAFSQGWRRVKLYFLTGLPSETDEDTLGIVDLAAKCVEIGRKYQKSPSVTVSVGGFVPKPQTPFQWFGQNTVDELRRKFMLLKDAARQHRGVQLKWHDPAATMIESLCSRGDRRVGAVIERVWRDGGTFQEWSEHFDLSRWQRACEAEGLDPEWYAYRHRREDEVLPWAHLSAGLHQDFLWQDFQDALAEVGLPDCRWTPCYDCGACTGYGIEHRVASATPPAGGSQGTGRVISTPVELSSGPSPEGVLAGTAG